MSPATTLSFDLPEKVNADSGQASMHLGSPLQASQTMALRVFGCKVTAPYSQAPMHQPQPSHLASSTFTTRVSLDWLNASLGQALMHGASLQARQVTAMLENTSSLKVRILDLRGLKTFSFSAEQAYSHTSQPMHLSVLQLINWLTVFKA
jgi:hypothetical protein